MRNRHWHPWLRAFLFGLVLEATAILPARALVGPAEPGDSFAPYVVMVLARMPGAAGFCSGVVLRADVVLTAAHCVAGPADTRVHWREADVPVLREVKNVAVHPLYRADAPRTRAKSIDLALVHLASPLPSPFKAVALSDGQLPVGAHLRIAGFGIEHENKADTGGKLRTGSLDVRAPLSSILLWAADPTHRGLGACTGDSGGPIFDAASGGLVAIVDWAEGAAGKACGALTQGALVAPQRAWIEKILSGWGE